MKRLIPSAVALLAFAPAALCRPVLAQPSAASKTASMSTVSKYQQAKDCIKQARALLRDFLAENPTGDDTYFAGLQLKALDNLSVTDIPITPVPLMNGITWRVITVDPQDAYTKVTLEFHNTAETSDQQFDWFDRYPLAIIASGKFYAMKQDGLKLPDGTRANGAYSNCIMQGGQTVRAIIYFEPLDTGVTTAQIKYQKSNQATPANFSLLNTNQRPGAIP